MNPVIIRRTILAELARSAEYALPAEQLLEQVNLRLRPTITAAALKEHLRALLDALFVDFIKDEMDPDNVDARRWLIREKGIASLKK